MDFLQLGVIKTLIHNNTKHSGWEGGNLRSAESEGNFRNTYIKTEGKKERDAQNGVMLRK